MEADSSTPPSTVGQDIATSLVSSGILSKAWEELRRANNLENFSLNEYKDVAYIAFPSFHKIEDFIVEESKYGEGNIQTENNVFSASLKGNDDQPALVHQGALKLFLHIMENTDFQAKMQTYTCSKQRKLKPIIFVGHSLGGAVATLATLWLLEKRLRQSSPFCITFGCPLVGDERLIEAVGRENWGGNFCQVVFKYDIVPHMFLAPFESIAKPLNVILPHWQRLMVNDGANVPDSFIQDACRTLLNNVRELDMVAQRSPYKPFGTSITGKRTAKPDSESSTMIGISLQLEAIGVGHQNDDAPIDLQIASDTENKHNANVVEVAIELSKKQCSMAELECYKERCEKKDGITYYDSFKKRDRKDIGANLRRVKLASFWDNIIVMCEKHDLPSDFQTHDKWIYAGNTYSRLVEPLDIAHYYFTNPKGNYISDGRPSRHKVLQKWMEDKGKACSSGYQKPPTKFASFTQDSCFWAYVEEALKDVENLKQGQHQKLESLEMFEGYMTRMINDGNISSEIFLEESSFMEWWKEWKEYKQNEFPEWSSPLYKIMESESWKG